MSEDLQTKGKFTAGNKVGKTHGHHPYRQPSPTWASWRSMRVRCNTKGSTGYEIWGGRGISICNRWDKFKNFLEDMGERPEGTSIDRIDSNGNYCPENCRWATHAEQGTNRRDNKNITFEGKTFCISEWERRLGFPLCTIQKRIIRGWSEKKALTTPRRNYPLHIVK